jgi:D-alanine-D-alanine ligase
MKKVAVFFGGRSYEHDVSILTGLQVCQVMDVTKYTPIPVYVNKVGRMFIGAQLLDARFYPVHEFRESLLTEVVIPVGETYPCLQKRFGFIKKKIPFDIAFCAFHGADGENGGFQGLFQTAGIPYTGADVKSSAVYMDKVLTKLVCRSLGIKVLDDFVIGRPLADAGLYDIKKIASAMPLAYPVMVKPKSLGSSVGIHRVTNAAELEAACLDIFKLGDDALCEPFVENLVEYNIAAVKDKNGKIITSAIERPNASGEVLSFADKYLAEGGAKKKGAKKAAFAVMPTMEMLVERREFSPKISAEQEQFIRESATKLLTAMGGTGAPRIDFIGNGKTGEIWLNEVNPIPGSFAFYLWVASEHRLLYQEIVDIILHNPNAQNQNIDLKQAASVVFK